MKPDWEDYYLGLSWLIKERSTDSTKNGAIVTTWDYQPLGIGYNGWPKGLDLDKKFTTRPFKYHVTLHAELNAINFSSNPRGGRIFVTGKPCPPCLAQIIQKGIKQVVHLDRRATILEDEFAPAFDELVHKSGIEIKVRPLNKSWLTEALSN